MFYFPVLFNSDFKRFFFLLGLPREFTQLFGQLFVIPTERLEILESFDILSGLLESFWESSDAG